MKSTREKILKTLLTYPGSTIKSLSEAVDINGISIRHHLNALEAEGMIESSEERHGVGRPHLVYSLTEKGVEEFPTSYLNLTNRVLSTLKQNYRDFKIEELFKTIADTIANSNKHKAHGKPLQERIEILLPILKNEGFIIESQGTPEGVILTFLNCPYHKIAFDHPEVCIIDQTLISKFLSIPAVKNSCINAGDDRCTFLIG